MKPIIGITTAVRDDKFSIRPNYVRWINKCGGIPVMIPVDSSFNPKDYDYLDGLLLAGGSDIDPSFYGEEPERGLGVVVRVRDEGELALLDRMQDKPVFGICRGMQLMNVYAGGTLHQDMYLSSGSLAHLAHRPDSANAEDYLIHSVVVREDSYLEKVLGSTNLRVPSTHHQSVHKLGKGLEICAYATDNVVEAIHGKDPDHFWLGVQWHPEKNPLSNLESTKLFTSFIHACNNSN